MADENDEDLQLLLRQCKASGSVQDKILGALCEYALTGAVSEETRWYVPDVLITQDGVTQRRNLVEPMFKQTREEAARHCRNVIVQKARVKAAYERQRLDSEAEMAADDG